MFIIPKRTATIATTATVVSSRMPCSTPGRCFDGFFLTKPLVEYWSEPMVCPPKTALLGSKKQNFYATGHSYYP